LRPILSDGLPLSDVIVLFLLEHHENQGVNPSTLEFSRMAIAYRANDVPMYFEAGNLKE
jgi:hypothetical protein